MFSNLAQRAVDEDALGRMPDHPVPNVPRERWRQRYRFSKLILLVNFHACSYAGTMGLAVRVFRTRLETPGSSSASSQGTGFVNGRLKNCFATKLADVLKLDFYNHEVGIL